MGRGVMVWLAGVAAIVAVGWLMYRNAYPVVRWHQTITVTVDTPTGPVTGASTQAMMIKAQPKLVGDMASSSRLRGEAVLVDLAGRPLFMLLEQTTSLLTLAHARARTQASRGSGHARLDRIVNHPEPVTLLERILPNMVTFTDPSDRNSVRAVAPDAFQDVFGAGYAFRSATIQTTDAPLTQGRIDAALPWFKTHSGPIETEHAQRRYGDPLYALSRQHFLKD